MVQRYEFLGEPMTCFPDGDYVKYEDYAALELQLNRLAKAYAELNDKVEIVINDE